MISSLRLLAAVAVVSLFISNLQAEESSFALPTGEPLATLVLPDGQKREDVSVAVSKALVVAEWENLGWEGNITTATTKKSRVAIKVFAVAAASEVKFYATYSAENRVTEEKCRQTATRELRALGALTAEKLNLTYRKGKGENAVDRAEAG